MDDWDEIFTDKILIRSNDGREITRGFDFPIDFFAIRDTQKSQWIFLIGLDQGTSTLRMTDANLAFAPVLDLASMADASSGPTNQKTAECICKALDIIFIHKDPDKFLSYNQIIV